MFAGDPLYFTKHVLSIYVSNFKTRFKSYLMYFLWSILGKLFRVQCILSDRYTDIHYLSFTSHRR